MTNHPTDTDARAASEIITEAARRLRVDGRVEIQQPVSFAMREVPVGPIAEWLDHSATMYRLYEGRGWSATQIDYQVSSSDRAALAFARSVLGARA